MPRDRRAQAAAAAQVLGGSVAGKLPWAQGVRRCPMIPPSSSSIAPGAPRWRSRARRVACARVGGQRAAARARVKLSLRLPRRVMRRARLPRCARPVRRAALWRTGDFDPVSATGGWNAPAFATLLESSISRASRAVTGVMQCTSAVAGQSRSWNAGVSASRAPSFFITVYSGARQRPRSERIPAHRVREALTACVSLGSRITRRHLS